MRQGRLDLQLLAGWMARELLEGDDRLRHEEMLEGQHHDVFGLRLYEGHGETRQAGTQQGTTRTSLRCPWTTG